MFNKENGQVDLFDTQETYIGRQEFNHKELIRLVEQDEAIESFDVDETSRSILITIKCKSEQ